MKLWDEKMKPNGSSELLKRHYAMCEIYSTMFITVVLY